MNFRDFFMNHLNKEQREDYAARVGTSVSYLLTAYFSTRSGVPRKRPGDELLKRMIAESGGEVTLAEGLEYFGVATIDELRESLDQFDGKNRQADERTSAQIA